MDKDRIAGTAEDFAGKAEAAVGKMTGDPGTEASGRLREAAGAESASFPSLGYGTDHRLTAQNLGGTALVHAEEVIHAAFFRLVETPASEGMASLQRRRRRFAV